MGNSVHTGCASGLGLVVSAGEQGSLDRGSRHVKDPHMYVVRLIGHWQRWDGLKH